MSETAPVAPAAPPPTCSSVSITDTLIVQNDFYSNFKNETGVHSGGDATNLKNQLRTTCSECTKIIEDAAKIDHAYLYACHQNGKQDYGDSPCRFFYYWFGQKYWNDLNGKQLSELLKEIYPKLEESSSCSNGNKCEFKYEDLTDKAIFDTMKTIFEYYRDYKKLPGLLSTYSGVTCAKKWSNYWTTVVSACTAMKDKCKEGAVDHSSKQYCKDYNDNYAIYCATAKLQKEKEKLITQTLPEAVRSATTTSSLSSIFGTLATIGAPVLIYKYKPWSSWFGNHTSGNGGGRSKTRKRRSNRQQEFEELTETSTVDFTTSLETSSTFDPNALRPATYTRQATRKRTNNTPGHHHRNNIGYSRM